MKVNWIRATVVLVGVALVLRIMGYVLGYWSPYNSLEENLVAEFLGIAITVGVIDLLLERDRRRQSRILMSAVLWAPALSISQVIKIATRLLTAPTVPTVSQIQTLKTLWERCAREVQQCIPVLAGQTEPDLAILLLDVQSKLSRLSEQPDAAYTERKEDTAEEIRQLGSCLHQVSRLCGPKGDPFPWVIALGETTLASFELDRRYRYSEYDPSSGEADMRPGKSEQ